MAHIKRIDEMVVYETLNDDRFFEEDIDNIWIHYHIDNNFIIIDEAMITKWSKDIHEHPGQFPMRKPFGLIYNINGKIKIKIKEFYNIHYKEINKHVFELLLEYITNNKENRIIDWSGDIKKFKYNGPSISLDCIINNSTDEERKEDQKYKVIIDSVSVD